MPLYSYHCAAGHAFERLAGRDEAVARCACGAEAERASVYRVSTGRREMDRRGDFRRYDEASQEMAYSKERFEDSAQVKVQEPPLWQAARQRADRLAKAGVTADQI